MTQKEYQDNINELNNKIRDLEIRLEIEKNKNYNYEKVLEDYHETMGLLERARQTIENNDVQLRAKDTIIMQYESILARININT